MSETPPAEDSNVGRIIADKYRIDAIVGTGGSGTVYRASHLVLGRNIALKVLNPNLVSNPTAKARFRREARAASKLDHPNSVQVFDYGIEPDGLTYLAMELLDGRELFKVIYDDWPLSSERTVKIMSQVLSVLSAAHDAGIVHRDLKPENIMLVTRSGEDGRPAEMVKVADFGIAKTFTGPMSEDSINLTRDGTVHGTPEYMSPEQARGEEVDGRTDLYACGIILYEMIVGALPFTGESAFEVILKQLSDPVTMPSARRPGVDRRIEPIVLRALSKDRAQRYPGAREMRDALLDALAHAPPPDSTRPTAESPNGRPSITTIAAAVAPPATPRGPLTSEPAMLLTRRRDDPAAEHVGTSSNDATSNAAPRHDAMAGTLDEKLEIHPAIMRPSLLPMILGGIGLISFIAVVVVVIQSRGSSAPETSAASNPVATDAHARVIAAPAIVVDSGTPSPEHDTVAPVVHAPAIRPAHASASVARPVRHVAAGVQRARPTTAASRRATPRRSR